MASFANLQTWQYDFIETVEIDECIVSSSAIKQIRENLCLEGQCREQLQAIRNTVVRHLGDLGSAAREDGDWDTFDRTRANMSGITAVIDDMMFR